MIKDEVIFQAPFKGMSDDPFIGSPQIQNLDIENIPGIVQLGLAAAKKSGTTITGIPLWGVMDNDANQTVYVVDNGHVVYKADSTSTYATWSVVTHASPSTGHGNGLGIWKGYLVLAGDTLLDFMLLSSGVWTNGLGLTGLTSLQSDTIGHPIFTSVDDKLYIGNGRYVASIIEVGTFVVGTPATYTATDKAITLPTGYRVRCLEDLGANLMIGTFVGNSLTALVKIARIYPYNRSTLTLGIPLILKEAGIHQMISINNELIFQAGVRGRWYKTNGSTSSFLVRIPPYVITNGPTISYPGAITFHKGKIYSGITSLSSSGGSLVYSFNTDGTKLVMERSISGGGQSSTVTIGCLVDIGGQTNDLYLVGWQDTNISAQGVDIIGADNFTSGYSGVFDTEIKTLGTTLGLKTYTKLEIYFGKVLATNEGIQVGYRTDTSAGYTSIGTFDFTNYGAIRNINLGTNITYVDQLQFRINLTGTTTTPHFKYLRLYQSQQQ